MVKSLQQIMDLDLPTYFKNLQVRILLDEIKLLQSRNKINNCYRRTPMGKK